MDCLGGGVILTAQSSVFCMKRQHIYIYIHAYIYIHLYSIFRIFIYINSKRKRKFVFLGRQTINSN